MLTALNRKSLSLTACLALAAVSNGISADTSDLDAMKAELQSLRQELAEIKAANTQVFTEEERKKLLDAQIEKTYQEAAALAAERSDNNILAGISDKGKIYLESPDGNFTIGFNGQIQSRYIYNQNDDRSDESASGFQIRRIKFGMKGTVGEKWGYKFVFATNRDGGGNTVGRGNSTNAFTEDVFVTYAFDDNWTLLVGTNKLPFARQEIISSTRMVAADRSPATEFFTLNRSEQATLIYKTDKVLAHLALSDGGNRDFEDFTSNSIDGRGGSDDFAVTARFEWQVMGKNWKEAVNEFGGVEEDMLFLAAAVHYEAADGPTVRGTTPIDSSDNIVWTAEALYKTGPLALSTALFGNHVSNKTSPDTNQYAMYAQAAYDLTDKWDVFAQWNIIDDDDANGSTDPLQAFVIGANHHFSSKVKLTGDVVYIYEGDNPFADGTSITGGELSDGIGLSSNGTAAEQVAFRLQLQLLF